MFPDLLDTNIQPKPIPEHPPLEIKLSNLMVNKLKNMFASEERGGVAVTSTSCVAKIDRNYVFFPNTWLYLAVLCKNYALGLLPYCLFFDSKIRNNREVIQAFCDKDYNNSCINSLFDSDTDKERMIKFVEGDNEFRPGKGLLNGAKARGTKDIFGSCVLKHISVPDASTAYLGNVIYYLAKDSVLYEELENEIINCVKEITQKDENRDNVSLVDNTCNLPQNRIISGAPGTGKSFKYETEKDEYFSEYQYERVTFHPAYSYAHFFGCYKPVNGAEGIEYKFVPGPFVRVWLKAMADPEHNYLLLIEEINRAEVAAVFGDVFQLLDRKDGISQYPIDMSEDLRKYISNGEWQENIKTSIEEIDTSQKMVIPQNMFIWATMNSADQGVYPMDTAFKRRWDYEYMPLDNKDVEKKLDTRNIQLVREKAGSEYKVQRFTWNEVRMAINNFLSGANINEDKLMGPFFLSDSVVGAGRDAENEIEFWKKFEEAFQNKVLLYLFEDAGKSKRPTLFEGAKPNHNRYSCIREEFANKGMRIFHEDISNKVHYYHNVDEAKLQEQNNKGETYEGSQP